MISIYESEDKSRAIVGMTPDEGITASVDPENGVIVLEGPKELLGFMGQMFVEEFVPEDEVEA